ncbi:MAG: MEDS domain-containing protein, partial [Candidatus Eisenbacteria bacterium]
SMEDLRPGDHVGFLYQMEDEHRIVLTSYLKEGFRRGEKVIYIVDTHPKQAILRYLRGNGVDVEEALAGGRLTILSSVESYGAKGSFDPERMLELVRTETEKALSEGYPAVRATGEMSWALKGLPGSERLIEYEARLDEMCRSVQVTALCQYDRRRFSPSVLLEVLHTHPIMIVGMEVLPNFYHISPVAVATPHFDAARFGTWVRNLVECRRTEEALRYSEEQLRQSQKMEVVGKLAGGVAHDFNNLIMGIMGTSEVWLSEMSPDDPRRADAEEILRLSEQAAALVRRLLTFGRKHVLDPKMMDVNRLLTDFEPMLRRMIGGDVGIELALGEGLHAVKADQVQMQQVLSNLVVNAREAMRDGGNITITTENVRVAEGSLAIMPESRPGDFVRASVTDTGAGMDAATREHLFEPFFSTKPEGTGLGLAVVYGIVKQHQGWVNVESEPGRGSTFSVHLPAVAAETEEETTASRGAGEAWEKGRGVLVVEDDATMRGWVTRALRGREYTVFEASSAQEALAVFEREKAGISLVLGETSLPDGNGILLADELSRRNPSLAILLTSGYNEQSSEWQVVRERCYGFIEKPYGLSELLSAVHRALEHRQAPERELEKLGSDPAGRRCNRRRG